MDPMSRPIIRALSVISLTFAMMPIAVHAQSAQLIVKLGTNEAESALTPKARIEKLGTAVGASLLQLREMALGAHVVAVGGIDGEADAERIAARLATDPAVEFAQVDYRRHALQALPVNDEYASTQHYLPNDPAAISAFAAWNTTHGSSNTVVAVIDTGYRVHADMIGRWLPGYNMISVAAVANDGDGRDADATDFGDFLLASEQTGFFASCPQRYSSWHGTGVAGIIAANANNGIWTAGIDWNARILPVRVLGKCGGYDSDIIDGIAWAAGLSVPGVPPNPTPAQVINLSLGGGKPCTAGYISVLGAAFAHGITRAIVVAAGNEAQDVANETPASCPGVIAVASTTSSGKLAAYSNFGAGITVSAPGGTINFSLPDEGIFVLTNTGASTPDGPSPFGDSIKSSGGTSFAAPMVTGTISLMLAIAPYLTPDQIRQIIASSAKPFPVDSDCTTDRCGAGIVDAGAAVLAAQALPARPASVPVIEYYDASQDHYFITWIVNEIAILDAGVQIKGWKRTGYSFAAYPTAQAGTSDICRFYIPPADGDSHFYGRGSTECAATGAAHPDFILEDPKFMAMFLPAAGVCPANTTEVYRVFDNRLDANHRYMTDKTVRAQMVAKGWIAEGDGPNLVVMCAPQ